MPVRDLEDLPNKAQLRGDLALLRRLLDQKGEPFFRIKTLRDAAQSLYPCARDADSIGMAIQLAIDDSFGISRAGEAAADLYGLADQSKGKPLRERRENACARWGADSYQTFRTGPEEEILTELAASLHRLLIEAAKTSTSTPQMHARPVARMGSDWRGMHANDGEEGPGMNRRYQVFISSTYEDLMDERDTVIRAVLRSQNIPFCYEIALGVNHQPTVDVLQEWIRSCDFFLLLLGVRCGSIDPLTGASYTSLEYDYAKQINKPVVVIWLRSPSTSAKDEVAELRNKQAAFITRVTATDFCVPVNAADELEPRTLTALNSLRERHPQGGWVRANTLDIGALDKYAEYVNMCIDVTLTRTYTMDRIEQLLRFAHAAFSRWFHNELGWLDVVVPCVPAQEDKRRLLPGEVPTDKTWLTVLFSGMKRTRPPTIIPTIVNGVPWRGSGNAFVSGGLDYVGSFQGLFSESYGLSPDVVTEIDKQYADWRGGHYFASLLAIAIAGDGEEASGVLNLNFKCENALDVSDNLAPEQSAAVVKMLEPLLRVLAAAIPQQHAQARGLK